MSGERTPKEGPSAEALREVRSAVAARRYADAQNLARRQLDAGVEHPQFLHLRSIWFDERGQFFEALADLERAHALDPSELGVLMALGNLLERLGRRVEARDAFHKAVALRPDLAGPRVRLGWAAENLGDIDGARESYRGALEAQADNAEAMGRLALIASQQGDWEEARAWAGRALQVNPDEFSAELATLRADVRDGRLGDAERVAGRMLSRRLSAVEIYLTHMELGALRHAEGRYEDAFAAWTKGNEVAHQHYSKTLATSGGMARMTSELGEYFAGQQRWPVAPANDSYVREHVFLLGFARSGTTLLEQVLAGHPDVVSLEEKETLRAATDAFGYSPEGMEALRQADEAALAPLRAAYWRDVESYGADPRGKVFIDKSPFNGLRLAHIARLFPNARILFAVRDPRDVVLSCFRTPFRVNGLIYELLRIGDAGRYYASYMTAAKEILRVVPVDCLELRHEDLLDDFEGEVGRICDFIGIDLRPEMLSFETSGRKVATPSAHQLREGLTRARAGQWTHYADQLDPAIRHLAPWIERFGYSL